MGEVVDRGWDEKAEFRRNIRDYSEFRYDTITAEDIDWIVDDAITQAKQLAKEALESEELSWDPVMGRLFKILSLQEYAYGKACFMGSVHPDKAVRDAAEEALLRFFRETCKIYFDPAVYEKLWEYSQTDEVATMYGERGGALNGYIEYFERIGHNEPPAKRDFVHRTYQAIIENEILFQRNIDEDKTVVLLDVNELEGMPQSFIDQLERDESGLCKLTMQYPHVKPVLSQCTNRETRHKVKLAFDSRGIESKNDELLEETVNMRYSVARKLGYKGWSAYVMDDTDTMAASPSEIRDFHDELLARMSKQEAAEVALFTKMLKADGYDGPLLSSDENFYKRKARQEKYPYDEERASEYFPTDAVLDGIFNLTGELFGLSYRKVDAPTWHQDVMAFAIDDKETGREQGVIYFDLYPRDGKYSHAATFPLKYGYILPDGTRQDPEAAIVCNFSRLMSLSDIVTLAHELGHALHQILGQTEEPTHAGFSVEFDFVEAPSQIMEFWIAEPEILKSFARHHQTGEPIPDELVTAMTKSAKLYNAPESVLHIARAEYDQLIHNKMPIGDFKHYVEMAKEVSPFLQDEGAYFPASFGHLMGGYDCLYYGYDYSLARAAVMFEKRFKKEGLRNPETGMDFRNMVLAKAGTEYGTQMFKDFTKSKRNKVSLLPMLRQKGIKV